MNQNPKRNPYMIVSDKGTIHAFDLRNVSVNDVRSIFGSNGVIIHALDKSKAIQIAKNELQK